MKIFIVVFCVLVSAQRALCITVMNQTGCWVQAQAGFTNSAGGYQTGNFMFAPGSTVLLNVSYVQGVALYTNQYSSAPWFSLTSPAPGAVWNAYDPGVIVYWWMGSPGVGASFVQGVTQGVSAYGILVDGLMWGFGLAIIPITVTYAKRGLFVGTGAPGL